MCSSYKFLKGGAENFNGGLKKYGGSFSPHLPTPLHGALKHALVIKTLCKNQNKKVHGRSTLKGKFGGHVPPVKIVVPPSKERKIVLGGCQNVPPPCDKYGTVRSEMFFIRVACGYGLRRYFPAYLVAIMVSFANSSRTTFLVRLLQNRTLYFSSTLQHVSSFLLALVKALRIC